MHFYWYGDKQHHPDYYAQVEAEYQRLDIADYMTLNGPESHIEEEYQKADAFCLPSLYEGYPNVVAEAMSCGLPVICSNRNLCLERNTEDAFLKNYLKLINDII